MFDHYFQRNPRTGKYFFTRIHDFKAMQLEKVLIHRFQIKPQEAKPLADFLMLILKWDPKDRPSAQEMLEHPWFKMVDDYEVKMTERQYKLYELKEQTQLIHNFDVDMNYVLEEK